MTPLPPPPHARSLQFSPTYTKIDSSTCFIQRRRSPRVLVVGAGVIGLTCALQLLDRG